MEVPVAEQRLHAIVHGRVQGVNFRWYTRQEAQRLGLTGWVRNVQYHRVEVVAEGKRRELEDLLRFLNRGSPLAQVEYIDTSWEDASGNYGNFSIRS